MKVSDDFDKTRIFNKQIFPLMQQVIALCNENKIPFFAAFGVRLSGGKFRENEGLECLELLPDTLEIEHRDPCFADFAKIMNGADALYPEEKPMDVREEDMQWEEGPRKLFGRKIDTEYLDTAQFNA